jgi:predicted nucleic acid-binding protein
MRSAAGNTIFTAQISLIELYSALNRRLREQAISPQRYARLSVLVRHIWSVQHVLVVQTPALLDTARQLVERHPLRAYDAVQLASALHARQTLPSSAAIIFLSADIQLRTAAHAEGFVTDDPNLH